MTADHRAASPLATPCAVREEARCYDAVTTTEDLEARDRGRRPARRHDLSHLGHTFASVALASGVPISEVSRWLGHRSTTTTADLYGHLVPEASGRARDALDRVFVTASDVPSMCPEGEGAQAPPQVNGEGNGRVGL